MTDALKQIASRFKKDPVGYAEVVLGVTLTPDQRRILELLTVPPYKVLVRSAHLTGKSFVAAVATLWWYDTHDPGIVLTTAPTDKQTGIVWKEVRNLRGPWGGFVGPKANELRDGPKHFARGLTARDGTAFQGHHDQAVMLVFDEAVGVEPIFWEAAETMLNGEEYAFLAIYNPTDQTSFAYQAEHAGNCHVVTLSALDHPNISAEMRGQPPPYPAAIRLARLDELIRQWSAPADGARQPHDIEWPPHGGHWLRPSPLCECRLLGRWPSQAMNAVWSEAAWDRACSSALEPSGPLQIGADIARFGDDDTAIHVRRGGVSLHHESHNGWDTSRTAARLRQLANEYGARHFVEPKTVVVAIDDIGVGSGVVDQAEGYHFVGVNGSSRPFAGEQNLYPNRRSELWFHLAEQAAKGEVSFARLPDAVRRDLRGELLSPFYAIDYQGRRVVERKDDTKKRLGKSPDNADAVMLAYARLNVPKVTLLDMEAPAPKPTPGQMFFPSDDIPWPDDT